MKYLQRLKSIIQMRAPQQYYPCKTNMAILDKVEDTLSTGVCIGYAFLTKVLGLGYL